MRKNTLRILSQDQGSPQHSSARPGPRIGLVNQYSIFGQFGKVLTQRNILKKRLLLWNKVFLGIQPLDCIILPSLPPLPWHGLSFPGLGQSSLSDAGGWPWLDLSESPESLELEELSLPELRASAEDKEEALPAQTICSPSKLLALMASRDRLQQKWPTVSQRNR